MNWTRRLWPILAAAVVLASLAVPRAAGGQLAAPPAMTTVRGLYTHFHLAHLVHLGYQNGIVSVAATSRSDYWAVGAELPTQNERAYALHWNGAAWKRMLFRPDPSFAPRSVEASSPHNVWFVGYETNPFLMPEALRWNGSAWSVIAIQGDPRLVPVILGPSDAWFQAGSTWSRRLGWRTVLDHWNGRSWKKFTLPVLGSSLAIGGSSDRNLWAVGITTVRSSAQAPGRLVGYRWTGRAWRKINVPRFIMQGPPLLRVSPSGEVWILGYGHSRLLPAIFHRSGRSWTRLSNRVLGNPRPLGLYPPAATDGLNGIWLGTSLYWSGRAHADVIIRVVARDRRACGTLTITPSDPLMAGIPGTHSILMAVACLPVGHTLQQGGILITKQS